MSNQQFKKGIEPRDRFRTQSVCCRHVLYYQSHDEKHGVTWSALRFEHLVRNVLGFLERRAVSFNSYVI